MATNFITCDAYRFMNFSTFGIIDLNAERYTLVDAITLMHEFYDPDHSYTYIGHASFEYTVHEDDPEADRKRERDTEGLNPLCWGYVTEGYEEDWEEDDDWDDDWSADYNGPAWCEETGWYE